MNSVEKEKLKEITKVHCPRKHKVTNSWHTYDIYKWIRKNKWFDIGLPLTEHCFYSIIRTVHKYFILELLLGKDIKFPERMGELLLRKRVPRIEFKDNKLLTNLPVNWDATLKLWALDELSRRDKVLIRLESKEIFKVCYNRVNATFKNKGFYEFTLNRNIKVALKDRIINNLIDAFTR